MEILTRTFVAPSGTEYTIREQNGQDEEVLTNIGEVNRGMNLSNYLQGIIMSTSKKAGKLTSREVLDIPILDRTCILIQSRIFSIGEELEFTYKWPKEGEPDKTEDFEYTLDLNEYLFSDYSNPEAIPEEEWEKKPKGIPFYPQAPAEDGYFYFDLQSGKKIRFHLADGNSELYLFKLREADKTKNTDLFMRGLQLQVEGKWETVSNFSLFSLKDMREMRKYANTYDPIADLSTTVENPKTGAIEEISIMSIASFFFPEEDV